MVTRVYTKGWAGYHWDTSASLEVVIGADLTPGQDMEPYRLAQWAQSDFRIRGGWPVPVPDFDARGLGSAVCLSGSVTSDRLAPSEVETNARARWIAGVNVGSNSWTPAQGGGSGWKMSGEVAGNFPTLVEDVAYRVRKEQLLRDAMQFQSDEDEQHYLLTSGFQPTSEFTIIMVLSLNDSIAPFDDDDEVDEDAGGLIGSYDDGTNQPALHMRSGRLAIQTGPNRKFESLKKSSLTRLKSEARPFFLSFAVGKPGVRSWYGTDPKNLTGFRVEYPHTTATQSSKLIIGGDNSRRNFSNMLIFDISYYESRLDRYAVAKEFKKLAKAYGGR